MFDSAKAITPSHLTAARAIDQLRRQLGIILKSTEDVYLGACPVEGMTEDLWKSLSALPQAKLSLLISAARAEMIGINTDDHAVRFDVKNLLLASVQAYADPLMQNTAIEKPTLYPTTPSCKMLLALAKHAGLLPAMIVVESKMLPPEWIRVSISEIEEYWNSTPLDIVPITHAKLPLETNENTNVICFRERYGTSVHLALVVGDISKIDAPLLRVHSSCVTGDILGSLRCDCGNQLHTALEHIHEEGAGVLLYLHQEGRGIGIANKLRAYSLQEQGYDTYQANRLLGFDDDERDFTFAVAIMKQLGIKKLRLLTNNPKKLNFLDKAGIEIVARIPLISTPGPHNAAYLKAKSTKAGHLF
jgi:GTP cyclohydrolase II